MKTDKNEIIRRLTAALERARHDLAATSGAVATDRPDLVTMPDDLSRKVSSVPYAVE